MVQGKMGLLEEWISLEEEEIGLGGRFEMSIILISVLLGSPSWFFLSC
jgi:hypothetical protein